MSDAELALVKLAFGYAQRLRATGWESMIQNARGRSNIPSAVGQLPHKAARLLSHLGKRGASVPLATRPWTSDQLEEALRRGPNQSYQGERAFVAEEMLDFCNQGYWIVLPFDEVTNLPGLRLSPLGVVPQRDRRPRLIVDYTFSGVNGEIVSLAPRGAMQFGKALQRMFATLVHADPPPIWTCCIPCEN